MKNSGLLFFLLLLCLLTLVGNSLAAEVEIYGPKQFVRVNGEPNIYTNTFSTTPKPGRIVVHNGNESGEHRVSSDDLRVSSAEVLLNGEVIFAPNDFNKNIYELQAPINLLENNTITVTIGSKPDTFLTVWVLQEAEPPIVTLSVNPETIIIGGSSALSWNSENAESCFIEPTIGSVDCNGSINVSPTETTTYILSANGLGGTVTTSTAVTINIPEPNSTLTADPLTINLGSNSTLSWTTTDAETIAIDQGVGEVSASGSKDVAPVESTTYTLTASNTGGTTTSAVTIEVVPIGVTIESPVDKSSVYAQSIPVKGRISTTAQYVEVSVNNRHALVNGNDFLVPDLVLEPGENIVTVRAVDSNGNSVQAEHVVTMSGTNDWLELQLGEAGGFAPLETTLSIMPHLQKPLNWDTAILEGSGPADFVITGAAEEGYQITFTDPGMYSLDLQIRDIDGTVYQERVFVSVLQPFSSADWQAMNEGVQQLEEYFTALLVTTGVESARQEVLEQAKENPDFSSATLSSGALCLVFKGLIPVILDLPDPIAPPTD